jgi:hypothetical protein
MCPSDHRDPGPRERGREHAIGDGSTSGLPLDGKVAVHEFARADLDSSGIRLNVYGYRKALELALAHRHELFG